MSSPITPSRETPQSTTNTPLTNKPVLELQKTINQKESDLFSPSFLAKTGGSCREVYKNLCDNPCQKNSTEFLIEILTTPTEKTSINSEFNPATTLMIATNLCQAKEESLKIATHTISMDVLGIAMETPEEKNPTNPI